MRDAGGPSREAGLTGEGRWVGMKKSAGGQEGSERVRTGGGRVLMRGAGLTGDEWLLGVRVGGDRRLHEGQRRRL